MRIALAIALVQAWASAAASAQAKMILHFIDVGQGNATLVEFPCGTLLVDTGGEKNFEYDGVSELMAYLEKFFADRPRLNDTIDLLVITHPHIDHTRGIPAVARRFKVANVVNNGQRTGSGGREQRELFDLLENSKREFVQRGLGLDGPIFEQKVYFDDRMPKRGITSAVIDPIACDGVDPKIFALWGEMRADASAIASLMERDIGNLNNHSVVLRIEYGKGSVLLTGDLEDHAIDAMVAYYEGEPTLDVDVYQAGHHGSYNGTTKPLLDAMTPKVAVISMGPWCRVGMDWTGGTWVGRSYGHPRLGVIEALEASVSLTGRPDPEVRVATAPRAFQSRALTKKIFGTGWDGTIVLSVDESGFVDLVSRSGQSACQ